MNTNRNNISSHNFISLIITALFTALIAVSAQITIPWAVPFTLQSLGVFLASAILGWKKGTLSVAVYIMLGAVGLPVFSGFQGGLGVLFGITGGYIWGFLLTAVIVGMLCEGHSRKIWIKVLSMVLGLSVCYLLGTVWYWFYTDTDFMSALALCVLPFLIPDGAKVVVAVMLVNRLEKVAPVIRKNNEKERN